MQWVQWYPLMSAQNWLFEPSVQISTYFGQYLMTRAFSCYFSPSLPISANLWRPLAISSYFVLSWEVSGYLWLMLELLDKSMFELMCHFDLVEISKHPKRNFPFNKHTYSRWVPQPHPLSQCSGVPGSRCPVWALLLCKLGIALENWLHTIRVIKLKLQGVPQNLLPTLYLGYYEL